MLRSTGMPSSLVATAGGAVEVSYETKREKMNTQPYLLTLLWHTPRTFQQVKMKLDQYSKPKNTVHLFSEYSQELCGSALHAGLKVRVWIGQKGSRQGVVERDTMRIDGSHLA